MLLFYVDECGDAKALKPEGNGGHAPSAWFVLSAVGIPDTSRQLVAETLVDYKRRHLGLAADTDARWDTTEIKGRYLAAAARAVENGAKPARRAWAGAFANDKKAHGTMHGLRNVFARFRPLIFVAAVDKHRLAQAGNAVDPLGAAYAMLHERVAQTLDRVNAGESAIFVADQQVEHESYFRDGKMLEARDAMASRLQKPPTYNRVLDKPLWIDTDLSTWDREIIQLADIVAYSTYELVKRKSTPTEGYYLWDAIEPCLARHWGSGKIGGGGLAIYPPPNRYPRLG